MPEVLDVFKSDTHRRVAANLGQPRSAGDLARFLHKGDPYVDDKAYTAEGVIEYLKDLEADGLVKQVGTGTGDEIVKAIAADDDLPTLPKDKAKFWLARASRGDAFPFPADEPQWAHTQAFLDRLAADVPGAPAPLKDDELARVEAENEQFRAREDEIRRKLKEDADE